MTFLTFIDWEPSSGNFVCESVWDVCGVLKIALSATQYIGINLRETTQLNCVDYLVLLLKWN